MHDYRLESRREISDQFLRDLQDMIDDREISFDGAQQILSDLFEPAEPGKRPLVKWSVWHAHTEERLQDDLISRERGSWWDRVKQALFGTRPD